MCEPTSISAGLALVGTAAQVRNSTAEANAQNRANEYNARLAERNAEALGVQASDIERGGELDSQQVRLDTDQLIATQRAGFAGSGVVVDQGSARDVILDTAEVGELDALQVRRNAAVQAHGLRNQAEDLRTGAGFTRARKVDPFVAGATTLLTKAGQFGGQVALSRIRR